MCIYALFMCFLPFLPNDVYGLAKQYGLKEGTKLSCDNLFTSFDLCAEKGIGVIGTVRHAEQDRFPAHHGQEDGRQAAEEGGRSRQCSTPTSACLCGRI